MPIEKRQRSPSVPFIGLMRATVGVRQLYDRVGRAPLLPSEAAEIWGLAAKTGSAFRRIAALRGYGLIEKADDPDRIRISHLAAILLETLEPEASQRAFAAAALSPEIIADYAGRWSAGRPSDPVCIADLQMRHRFTAPAAKGFLPVFDEAMWFVGGGLTGVVPAAPQAPSPSPSVSIGDWVRLPTDTGDQYPDGRRVVWLADAGRYVYVEKDFERYPVQAITRIKSSSSAYASARTHRPQAVNTGEEATPNSEAGQWLDFPRIELREALHYLERLVDAAGRD